MKQLYTFIALLCACTTAIATAIPTSTIQCYIDPANNKITTHACMNGRCIDYKEQVCDPGNLKDIAALRYYNSRSGELLYTGEFPCSTANATNLCKTYQGPAALKL